MEIQKNKSEIVKMFSEMSTVGDFASLLSYAKKFYYKKETLPISVNMLYYYAKAEYSKNRYVQFTIPKKSGGIRTLHAPCRGLKSILRVLNFVLQNVLEPHRAATGFVPGKSIVDNASMHVDKNYVYNIDLKDFFHSFDKNRVKLGLIQSLKRVNISIEEPIAYLIASLCTHPLDVDGDLKYVLPQGSPTSPTLTNILCCRLDRRLNGLAKRYNLTYSRYADDITFSSDHNVYNDNEFLNELKRIITVDNKYEFEDKIVVFGPELQLNNKKTRLQKKNGYRQEVTGLIVNEKVNVSRRYVKTIRTWLYQWERFGYENAQAYFLSYYLKDKGHIKDSNAKIENVLKGKLLFLKMVKGEDDRTYKKLYKRFNKLNPSYNHIDELLDIWESEGIDAAFKSYKSNFINLNDLFSDISLN